jgi:hypothetical protein
MATPSLLLIPDRYKSGVLYSQLPESGAGDIDFTRASAATRVNASGLIESVASGVPRLDYTGGGCPSLLLEPQRTNLALRSEQFDDAAWITNASPTITANTTIAPDGTTTADTIAATAANSGAYQVPAVANGVAYSFSVYIKNISGATNVLLGCDLNPLTATINFNPTTGQIISLGGSITSSSVTNVGNGWYRVVGTYISTGTQNTLIIFGTGVMSFAVWGAQLEAGSYPTSYIPTTSAAVTRAADEASKTAVSGLIGQTAGTLYAEIDATNFAADDRILAISDGTSDERIVLQKGANATLQAIITTASGSVADIATASGTTAGVYKIALAYATNDFVLYVNGSQIGTDTAGAVPACSQVFVGKIETSATTNQLGDRIRAAAIYTTRLSNTELAALTSL